MRCRLKFFAPIVLVLGVLFPGGNPFLSRSASAQGFSILYQLDGTQPNQRLGESLACLDSFSAPNSTSVAIGSPGGLSSATGGIVEVRDGATGAATQFQQASSEARDFGTSVAPAGNTGGSALQDLIIGGPQDSVGGSDPGIAHVYDGDGSLLSSPSSSTAFSVNLGFRVLGLFDDADNDGNQDILVSGPFGSSIGGYVMRQDANSTSPEMEVFAVGSSDLLGYSLGSLSDQNADGIRDILVGAPGALNGSGVNSGVVRIVNSVDGQDVAQVEGLLAFDQFGFSLSVVPDVNGDGNDDFLVGAPQNGTEPAGTGYARLYSGAPGNPQLLCSFAGSSSGDQYGYAVSGLGDVDGDGDVEFAIGAPGSGTGTGKVEIYSYSGGICSIVLSLPGFAQGDYFGISFTDRPNPSKGCDLNQDGFLDFGVGSVLANFEGRATFYKGEVLATPTPTATPTGTETPTPTVSATPTAPATATATISPSPTPTAAPTPTALPAPSSARLTYRLARNGELIGLLRLDREPTTGCRGFIFGRHSRSDLSDPGPVQRLLEVRVPSGREYRFRAANLQRAFCAPDGKPWSYHMVAKMTCGDSQQSFFSNVIARQASCGLAPPLPIEVWESQLFEELKSAAARRRRKR